ncbi:IPT/TIG domain-containing protein [Kitasatospora sp. NPDC096147]|uniref:IPT/TIG domain-containing protein n=1 Tax=Kitasatospora sp. NPDC096147 TaxID=3364093 RepID=UPI0037FFF98E
MTLVLGDRVRRGTAGLVAAALVGALGAVAVPAGAAHAEAEAARLVYVANLRGNSVSAYDPVSGAVVATVPVGRSPEGVAVSPDGAKAYVTNNSDNSVSVIDTATNTVAGTIAVGRLPGPVAISPDGRSVYVGRFISPGVGGVDVIDTATQAVTGTVQVGNQPFAIGFAPDGRRAYVANFVGSSVSVIDTASTTVSSTIARPDARTPSALAVSPDGGRVYVANFNSNNLSVIDTATDTITALVPTGGGPGGVAVSPDGRFAYTADENANTLSVLDTSTLGIVASVPVGSIPVAVLADPDGDALYVANGGGNTLSVVDPATHTVTGTVPTGNTPFALGQAQAAPVVDRITPDQGPAAGGTTVTLTGRHLAGTRSVSFGGAPAANVTVVNATTVTATAPPHAPGTVDVQLTSAGGRTVPAGRYTYRAPAPVITGIAPDHGPAAGGTVVTITGGNLGGATAVSFGAVPAAAFTVESDGRISATAPSASAAGPVDLTVTTPGGSAKAGYNYTRDTSKLTASPLLLSIAPGQLSVNLTLAATLTDTTTGRPVPGATIRFTVGSTAVCSGVTDANGTARCTGLVPVLTVLLHLGYTATYAGGPALEPASATAGLIRLG